MNLKLKLYQLKKKIAFNFNSKNNVRVLVGLMIIVMMFVFFLKQADVKVLRSHVIVQPKKIVELNKFTDWKPKKKVNACFVILVRNTDLGELKKTLKNLERVFNKKYQYPYVLLNDIPFTDEFKKHILGLTDAVVEFGQVPQKHWSIPDWIDKDKAKKDREKMAKDGIIYGGSLSYRHMCRFESGLFFRHNLTLKYDYYWRVEPGVTFSCEIDTDPFLEMVENKKQYGFVISLLEFESTIKTLWKTTNDFIDEQKLRDKLPKDNALKFISNDNGKTYNLCHFWSNFEIADFRLWRSQQYLDYFDYLDRKGGFFYERWGDAPVHSIYAALFLSKSQIHFFNKIGYTHPPYTHCPIEKNLNQKCFCDPKTNFDFDGYSCNKKWFDLVGHK